MNPRGRYHYRLHSARLRLPRRLTIPIIALASITTICAPAQADQPSAVDHSREKYFPPIGGPQEMGDCTCWSSAYYYCTYTQARDEGRDASAGDPRVVCSVRFLFALIAEGSRGAECTRHAMSRLSDVGCAPISMHSLRERPVQWPTSAGWLAGLNNRMGAFHAVRIDVDAGLETVKQQIADGGCAVTRALFHENYVQYGDSAGGPGIDNHVMYKGVSGNHLRHSLCICGYDDNVSYYDADAKEWRSGAFLIANSEGPDWGWYNTAAPNDPKHTKGYLWVAYQMFRDGEFGRYDNDDNPYVDPCFDNPDYPEAYFHEDRPHYRPKLYAVAGINHNARNLLTFSGGVGPANAPEFTGPEAIQVTDFGDIPIDDSRRPVVDLTDGAGLIPPGTTKDVFISLAVAGSASQAATITSVDFYCDFDGDGVYSNVPGQMRSAVTVAPGSTGYVSASVTAPILGDLDGDGSVGLSDQVQLLDHYGTLSNALYAHGDLDCDGDIDLLDLEALLANCHGRP